MKTEVNKMAEAEKTKWTIEADYFQACNCDYGCPCEFEAPPTQGYCEGMGTWRIAKGRYGNVSLNGLGFGFVARWPEAIHKGNGVGALFFDEKASAEQRQALLKIAGGEAGGMPFEVIAKTFAKVMEPKYVSFHFSGSGKNQRVQIGAAASMAFEPIKNPVTGASEGIRIEHETGFIFKSAEVLSAKECKASVEELNFSYPGKSGFITKIRYAN